MSQNPYQKRVEKFLLKNHYGVLATADNEGQPNASTVYYVNKNANRLYLVTSTKTQKFKNLLENPKFSLAVGFGPKLLGVQLFGKAEMVLPDDPRLVEVMKEHPMLMKNSFGKWIYASRPDLALAVIELRAERANYIDAKMTAGPFIEVPLGAPDEADND